MKTSQIKSIDVQAKEWFDKLSKKLVSQLFNWDTETFLELKKTNFI